MLHAKSRSRAHPAPMAAVAAGLLAALVSLAACADIIRLTNGREIRGVVVSEADGRVVVKVPGGTLSIPADMVAYIERESEVTYRLWQAKDLSSRGSDKMAVEELRAALRLEPGSGEAKGALASALRERARSLEAAGSLSEARRAWEEVISLKGGDAAATAAVERIRSSVESLRRDIVAAKRLLSAKDSAGASAAFERILAAAPEMRPELSSHYACSLIGVGDDLYRRRDYAGAAARYSLALEFDPTLAQEIEPRYVNARLHVVAGKINSGLFDEAEKELKALAGFSPTNAEVRYVTGRYAEVRGRWREAAVAYARALNVALAGEPDAAKAAELRGKLETKLDISRTTSTEESGRWTESQAGDWLVAESDHFAVHHHNAAVADVALSTAEYHYERIMTDLGLGGSPLEGRLRIYVYRTAEEYARATGQPDWSGGVSHVELRGKTPSDQYIASYQGSPHLLKAVIPHELTHILFGRAVGYGREFPLALHEGVATAMEPEFKQQHCRSVVWSHLRTDTLIPLQELLAMKKYPDDPDLFYAESARLVEMLLRREGPKRFLEFAGRVNAAGIDAALAECYGFVGVAELEQAFREYVSPKTAASSRQ